MHHQIIGVAHDHDIHDKHYDSLATLYSRSKQ